MIKKTYVVLAAVALVVGGALPATAAEERDLKTEPAEFMASGNDIQDRLGRSIAFGDIDNDGFADLASGAPLDEPPGVDLMDNRGALHVYFGKSSFAGTSSTPDLIIYGEEGCTGTGCALNNNDKSDVLGKGVTMGDVNDDGKPDLVVSALRAKAVAGGGDAGRVGKIYIFFNRSRAGWNSINGQSAAQADVTIIGDQHQGDIGIHLATGDFDKDGIRDLLAGAAAVNSQAPGGVWVVYGRKTWPATIDLRSGPVAETIFFQGTEDADKLGHGVAAGDVNGDGTADIAAGAPFGGAACGGTDPGPAGVAYVIFGPVSPTTVVQSITSAADVTITSDDPGDELGRRLAIGNVGGSATRDLILGAPCGDGSGKTNNGVAYVLFGPLTAGTKDADTANLKVHGEDTDDSLGVDVAAGDVTGDGKADLILGADGGDGPAEDRPQAGEAAVLLGSVPTGTRNLASSPADLTVYGDNKDDHLGIFVGAGNVNGAGGADIGLTAPVGNGLVNQPQAGEVHVLTSISGGGGAGCTITGTAAGETLVGTAGNDVICGKGGKDTLLGKGGNDTLKGGAGADTLDGGGGADTLRGQGGNDTLLGRGGKDDAKGAAGKDTIKGGAGADTVAGGGGDDNLKGQGGNDLLRGGPGNDILNGGPGVDTCKPGKGNDVVKNCE